MMLLFINCFWKKCLSGAGRIKAMFRCHPIFINRPLAGVEKAEK
jgi:hypothetical protein